MFTNVICTSIPNLSIFIMAAKKIFILNIYIKNICVYRIQNNLYYSLSFLFHFLFSFSHGQEVESSSVTTQKGVQNTYLNDGDRLQVQSVNSFSQRRESFLYRSDSDVENSQPPRSSRHSSVSSEG